jgi:chitin-binding protein
VSAACKAAVALGGTQPLYDWNEVNIANAAGRHREIIPDGRLCSGGRDKYAAFDVARVDWPTTRLPAGGNLRFMYKATAPHRGRFELYVTVNGYDPGQPLRWSDLEAQPFHSQSDPPYVDGAYVMDAPLPAGKSGHHVIYTIWQRSDSPEAFYSCADVAFGDGPIPAEVITMPPGTVDTEPPPATHDHGSSPEMTEPAPPHQSAHETAGTTPVISMPPQHSASSPTAEPIRPVAPVGGVSMRTVGNAPRTTAASSCAGRAHVIAQLAAKCRIGAVACRRRPGTRRHPDVADPGRIRSG